MPRTQPQPPPAPYQGRQGPYAGYAQGPPMTPQSTPDMEKSQISKKGKKKSHGCMGCDLEGLAWLFTCCCCCCDGG